MMHENFIHSLEVKEIYFTYTLQSMMNYLLHILALILTL